MGGSPSHLSAGPGHAEGTANTLADMVQERLIVTRRPADRLATPDELHAFDAGTLEVLEMRDEPSSRSVCASSRRSSSAARSRHRLTPLEGTVRRVDAQPGTCKLPPEQPVTKTPWTWLKQMGKDFYDAAKRTSQAYPRRGSRL